MRPAVLLAEIDRDDWLVCQVISSPAGVPASVALGTESFTVGGLAHISYARPAKLFTAHESLALSVLGQLSADTLDRIIDVTVAALRTNATATAASTS